MRPAFGGDSTHACLLDVCTKAQCLFETEARHEDSMGGGGHPSLVPRDPAHTASGVRSPDPGDTATPQLSAFRT